MLARILRPLRSTRAHVPQRAYNTSFYIDGAWRPPTSSTATCNVTNPATAEPVATLALGAKDDVDVAVECARSAFDSWSVSSKADRLAFLQRLLKLYEADAAEMAAAVSSEMGAPISLAKSAQVPAGLAHIRSFIDVLAEFAFEERLNSRELLCYEPVGVCACITPWNWPLNQIALKVVPALAAGCTVVLKPSEIAPLSAARFAALVDAAGLPPGVFNLVHGRGDCVGAALAAHPHVDMVSFTGSTRGGVAVSAAAAVSIKRVTLELGGKGPNIIFADLGDGLRRAVERGVAQVMLNSGQSAPRHSSQHALSWPDPATALTLLVVARAQIAMRPRGC